VSGWLLKRKLNDFFGIVSHTINHHHHHVWGLFCFFLPG